MYGSEAFVSNDLSNCTLYLTDDSDIDSLITNTDWHSFDTFCLEDDFKVHDDETYKKIEEFLLKRFPSPSDYEVTIE